MKLRINDTVRVVGDKTKELWKVVGLFGDDVEKAGTDFVGKVKLRRFGFKGPIYSTEVNKLRKVARKAGGGQ
jgi:hypothetical protein